MIHRIVIFVIIIFSLLLNYSFAKCNFKQYKYINELKSLTSVKSIEIDINNQRRFYKNFARIIVSEKEEIPKELKKNFKAKVKINYFFGNCVYKARVRQLGDWKDHIKIINGQPQRSLKVSLNEGNIINAVKFKLYIPETRENHNEILGSVILRELGFLSPETFETNMILNGSKFKMLFQEDTTKEFLERNFKREGPIFEGDESLLWSYKARDNFELEEISLSRLTNHKWFLKGNSSEYIVLKAFALLQEAYLKYVNEFPNTKLSIFPNTKRDEIFQDYYFILTAMNGWHALRPHNRKFYYNSFIEKFEPIYYDGMFNLNKPLWTNFMNRDLDIFDKNYSFQKLSLFDNSNFFNKILKNFEDRIISPDKKSKKFVSDSIKNIKKNINILQKKIKINNNIKLENNVSNDRLVLNYLSKLEKYSFKQNNIIKLEKNNQFYTAYLIDNQTIQLNSNDLSEILRNNNLIDKRYVILNSGHINQGNYINKNLFGYEKINKGNIIYSKGITINQDNTNKIINIYQNTPTDWILFKNVTLPNWKINFFGKRNGSKSKKDFQRLNNYGLTGCLNFFNSIFENNLMNIFDTQCEDGLNVVNSKGNIKSIYVNNSFSDAVDFDFSNINVNELNVEIAGNDCLDLSGGNYKINNSNLINCGDKGISIGEMSSFEGNRILVKDSTIGISVKDFSKSLIQKYKASSVDICVESMMKKQEFGGAIANFKLNDCEGIYKKDSHSIINRNHNEL